MVGFETNKIFDSGKHYLTEKQISLRNKQESFLTLIRLRFLRVAFFWVNGGSEGGGGGEFEPPPIIQEEII